MRSEEPTRELIAKARGGDREAFDALAREHRARVLSFIRTRLGARLRHETDPEDVLQQTYLKALESLDRFQWRGERSFFAWLATIAEHVIRGLGRARKLSALPSDREPVDTAPSPSHAQRREERFQRLEEALAVLSEDHRRVIRLTRIEGLPIAEVARRMQRSPGAVRHLLLRALEKLRDRFGEDTESLGLPERSLGEKGRRGDDE